MKAIVAVDKLWGIGKNGDLLFHNKEDMKFFRKTTKGKVVVMGRKTLESLPNGEPLSGRINLVLTNDKSYQSHDNLVYGDLDKINEEIKKYNTNDVFVIGGGCVYRQFIRECDTFYVTHNNGIYNADTHILNLAFEGYKLKNRLNTIEENELFISEWECLKDYRPYKSVLWLKDPADKILFLYCDCIGKWKNVLDDSEYIIDDKIKGRIKDMIISYGEGAGNVDKIHNYHIAHLWINDDRHIPELRIASYGYSEREAKEYINHTLEYLTN